MKYVCLVYLVEKEMNALSEREADACTDESLSYDEALRWATNVDEFKMRVQGISTTSGMGDMDAAPAGAPDITRFGS